MDLCSGASSNSSLAEAENPSQSPFPLFSCSQQFVSVLINFIIFKLPIKQLQYTVLSTVTVSECPGGACKGLDVLTALLLPALVTIEMHKQSNGASRGFAEVY